MNSITKIQTNNMAHFEVVFVQILLVEVGLIIVVALLKAISDNAIQCIYVNIKARTLEATHHLWSKDLNTDAASKLILQFVSSLCPHHK